MDAGFASRLMFDDWPFGADMLKPAMKGSEGERAPWEVKTEEGCTFWKDGKCELHQSGLKPIQGKLAHHANTRAQIGEIEGLIRSSWDSDEATEVIERWKKEVNYEE